MRSARAWLENAVPDRMGRVPDELADEEEIERFTEHIGFRFSPFSSREAELSAYKNRDGPLGVGLSVSMCSPGIPTPNWVPTLACTGPRTVLACSTSTIRCAGCSPSGRSRSPEHDRGLNVVRGKEPAAAPRPTGASLISPLNSARTCWKRWLIPVRWMSLPKASRKEAGTR